MPGLAAMVVDACSDTLGVRLAILDPVFANADFSGSEYCHTTFMTLVMSRLFDVSVDPVYLLGTGTTNPPIGGQTTEPEGPRNERNR